LFTSTNNENIKLYWYEDFESFVKIVAPFKDIINNENSNVDIDQLMKPLTPEKSFNIFKTSNSK